MSKKSSIFYCQNCGTSSSKWLGKCPSCNQWNTFVEERTSKKESKKDGYVSNIKNTPKLLNEISTFIKNKHSKKAIINEVIDKKLIAGLKLRIGNTILDGTVSNKLKKLKNNLINNSN